MTVAEIIIEALRKHGADGLCNDDCGCSCLIDDLMPCDEPCGDCVIGWKCTCPVMLNDYQAPVGWVIVSRPCERCTHDNPSEGEGAMDKPIPPKIVILCESCWRDINKRRHAWWCLRRWFGRQHASEGEGGEL